MIKLKTGAAGIVALGLVAAPTAFIMSSCASESQQIAATVNGSEITEETITNYVQSFRQTNGLESDEDWAQWMVDNGRDAAAVRNDAIDYFVQLELIDQAAKEKGIEVTSEEVDNQLNEIKSYYGFTDEEFNEQLETLGYTPDTYREYLEQQLVQEKLMEKVNEEKGTEVPDEEVLTTANSYSTILNGAKEIETIVVEDEAAANDLKSRIDAGEDFSTLAQENSVTSDYNGWDVMLGIDQTIYSALENAGKGDVTEVLASDDGSRFFIVKVNNVLEVDEENGFTSIDDIPADLRTQFEENVKASIENTNFDTYLQNLKDSADIVINDMPEGLPYDVSTEGVEPTSSSTSEEGEVVTLDENGNVVEDENVDVDADGTDVDVDVVDEEGAGTAEEAVSDDTAADETADNDAAAADETAAVDSDTDTADTAAVDGDAATADSQE